MTHWGDSTRRKSFYNNPAYHLTHERDASRQGLGLYHHLLRPGVTLEIGCGKSPLGISFPGHVGVDFSFEALRSASGKRVCADWMSLPFRSDSVDLVFSNATLEHVPDPSKAVEETVRVLKRGGVIIHNDAWFCRPWTATGITVKSYHACSPMEKLLKLSIVIRNHRWFRGLSVIPKRLTRELIVTVRKNNFQLGYTKLTPNLDCPITSDSDAFTSMDPHAVALFYKSRGFFILKPRGGLLSRLLYSGYVACRKG